MPQFSQEQEPPMSSETPVEEPLFCRRHPHTETTLRCYQCGAPICHRCAQRTPVGYQCPDCKRGIKRRFEQARPLDYGVALVVSLILGGIAGMSLPFLGWFTLFLSPIAGTLIAEIVWRLVRRRYGSRLGWIVAAGIVVGTLPAIALHVVGMSAAGSDVPASGWLSLLWPLVHIGMAVGTATARLK